MKKLWAPWRMEYINSIQHDNNECFLCEAYKSGKDREALILFRSKNSFVIMNKYPYNNGHLLIVPIRHISNIEELNDDEKLEMMNSVAQTKKVLEKTLGAQGFNIGINLGKVAGAGLESHIHMHIVPRWAGDTNFMPIFGDTKVISEANDKTYEKLLENLRLEK